MKKTMQKLMGLAALFGVTLLGVLSAQAEGMMEILVCKESERTANGDGTYTYTDSQNVQKTFSYYASSLANAVTLAAGSDCTFYIGGTGVVSGDKVNPVQFVVNAEENDNVTSIYLDANAEMAVGKASTCTKVDISRFHGLGFVSAYGMVEIDKSAVSDDFTGTLGIWGTISGSSSFVSSIENAASFSNLNNNGATLYISGKAITVGNGKTLESGEVLKTVVDASDFTIAVESQDGGSFKNQEGSVVGTKGELAMLVAITNYSCYSSPSTPLATWNGNVTGDIDISLKDARMVRTATFVGNGSANYTYDSDVTAVVDHSQFYQTQNGGDYLKKGLLTASMWNAGSGTLTQNGNVDYVVKNTVYASGAATTMYALYSVGSGKSVVNGDINIGFFDNTADSFSVYGVNNAGSVADKAELNGNLRIAVSGSTMGSFYGSVNGKITGEYSVAVTNSTAKTFAVLSGDLAAVDGDSSITFDGNDTVSTKISGFDTVAIHEGATLNVKYSTGVDFNETWSNAGTMTVDMTGATGCKVMLVDCTGEGPMTLQDYGTVTLTENDGYSLAVIDNDLYATKPVIAQVISDGGATTNEYDNLSTALTAAKTSGSICELQTDIDLTGVEWTPIADFNGTFDGKGHTISHLTVTGTSQLGLFANTGTEATIKDVTITDASITSTSGSCHGVLAGSISGSTVTGVKILNSTVTNSGTVEDTDAYTAGLCGTGYPKASNCEVAGCTISGYDQVGGFVGYLWVGHIENCIATNNIISAHSRAGGLVGKFQVSSGNLGSSSMWLNGNTIGGTATADDMAGGVSGQIMGDDPHYEIKNNLIDVALTAPQTSPIGILRDDQPVKFTSVLAKNITGNWWEEKTLAAASYTYPASLTGAGDQVINCGKAGIAGGKNYKTLAAALADVKDGDTIEIYADNAESVTVPDGVTTFTFNSNGFDLSKGSISVPAAYKFVRSGNVCTYQARVYGVAVVQQDGTVRGTYESIADAVTAAQEGDTVTILQNWTDDIAVPAGKSITFDGRALDGSAHTLDGAITVADGGSLTLLGGTFTANPFAYLPDDKAVRVNDDGSYTVVVASVAPVQEELPEAGEVTDEKGNEVAEEKQEQASVAVETLKTNLVESVADPVVTKTDSGLNEVVKENESVVVAALKAQATEDGLTEGAKDQIDANIAAFIEDPESNTNSANYVTIAVETFDATVASVTETTMTGTATKVVYEVTPIIATTVSNTVDGATEVVTVSAAIPNATVKEMAEKGNPITFNLPILDANATMATVKHVSSEPTVYPTETFTCPVWTDSDTGKRYITVSVSHFSTFEVTTSGAVLVDSDETIGIYKLDKLTAGEISFGVPFLKSGTETETDATLAQLVTTGAQTGDSAKAWTAGNTDTNAYAAVAAGNAVAPGKTLWYTRASASTVPLTLAGYVVTNGIVTAGEASATSRPGMTLFANPHREAVDFLAKLTSTPATGDKIVIEGDTTRYTFNGTAWTKPVQGSVTREKTGVSIRGEETSETVDSLLVPAGKTVWYVSATVAPSVKW